MRILFAGSPDIAVPSLLALSEMECGGEKIELAGVLTNTDSAQGRKGILLPTEVSAAAAGLSRSRQELGFSPILQFKYEKLDVHARKEIAALKCDLLVAFAYGRLFGPKFLALFPKGGINIHPSLLPRHRGPSPIPAAILARDKETGITIQKLVREMDAGDILAREKITLDIRETTASLSEKSAIKAAEMLRPLLLRLASGAVHAEPQQGEPTYCSLITREMGIINWNLSALEIDAQVRAYYPWPLCFTGWEGEELYILEGSAQKKETCGSSLLSSQKNHPGFAKPLPGLVECIDRVHGILIQTGDGLYAVSRLQRRAKKALDWKDFLNGARGFIGSRLE